MLSITVDTLIDEADFNLNDGDISLRDAIWAATTNQIGQPIDFSVTGEIDLSLGEMVIDESIVINGPGDDYDGATSGGASRINYNGSSFTVDPGFEDHPVTYVSWYGATSFCNYYGYRLPTEWEWQAVADYDDSFTYGCGTSINNSIANYAGSTHPDGTTVVGSFDTFGYGMDHMLCIFLKWVSIGI